MSFKSSNQTPVADDSNQRSVCTILIELVSLLGDFLSGRLDEYIVISIVKVVIDVNDGTALHLGHLPHIVGGPATDFPFMSVRIGSPSP